MARLKFFFNCIVLLIFSCVLFAKDDDSPVVRTQEGLVKGTYSHSRNGRAFKIFRGIPYAKPPLDELRFKAPQPVDKWDHILDATKEGPVCIQKNYLFANPVVEGQEDCLYLNVYVPEVKDNNKLLPVMVSIHWGGYFAGRGTKDFFGPEKMMDKDIVLVTFNYRLGIMGLLSTLDDEAPGNNAMKDQVEVLKWVQRNIQGFGGDPGQVTLFGNSAGASSAHLHMISPLSRGLFHRAISQSGSGLALWSTPLNDLQRQIVTLQASLFHCKTTNSKVLLKCLRRADAKALVESGDIFKYLTVDPLSVYTLVTENKTERNPEPFLTKMPKDSILAGEFQSVPWIIGTVQNEGELRASALVRQKKTRNLLNKSFADLMIKEMYYQFSVPQNETRELYKKAQDLYMGGEEFLNVTNPRNIQGFIDKSPKGVPRKFLAMLEFHRLRQHEKRQPLHFEHYWVRYRRKDERNCTKGILQGKDAFLGIAEALGELQGTGINPDFNFLSKKLTRRVDFTDSFFNCFVIVSYVLKSRLM